MPPNSYMHSEVAMPERDVEPLTLTEKELDDWLLACDADPSIVHPRELGYLPDGTRKRRRT
jgi:hypothetical protein